MPDANTASVMTVFQSGTQFDPNLAGRLTNAQVEIGNVQQELLNSASQLDAAGIGSISNLLDNFDPTNELGALADYITNTALPNLFTNLDLFQAAGDASIVIADDIEEAAALAAAFGSLFAARGFSSACDDIGATLPNLSNDVDGANAANIADRVNQLAALPGAVPNIIQTETDYFTNCAITLNVYSQSLQTLQAFDDFNYKAVLGAVASDQLLNILKPDDTLPIPPPLPPPPPPPPTAPPNQNADPTP